MHPRIVPTIFNWRGQYHSAVRTEAALASIFGRVLVINSDESCTRPGWIDVGDTFYFTGQFLRALDLFDGDVLFHVQADASYGNWQGVVDNAVRYLERYRWGVFAPHVDFSNWTPAFADVGAARYPDPHLRLVSCTDCTCWFIHRDVLERMAAWRPLFERGRLGMGIDMTACALSYASGRPVLRDYEHVVDHPRSRGYDTTEARAEFAAFRRAAHGDVGVLVEQMMNKRHGDIAAWLQERAEAV